MVEETEISAISLKIFKACFQNFGKKKERRKIVGNCRVDI